MDNNEQIPHKPMVLIALIQGFCLLYLHQAIEIGFWPNNNPQWLFAFYSVALSLPLMLLLSINHDNIPKILKYTLPFTLLSGLLGYYIGNQATPIEYISYDALLFSYALTIGLASFKALIYIQQIAANEPITYSNLFRWSWRNFLTLSLSFLFAGSFWLILLLWGALFQAINIDFFKVLFEEAWFYYPAIALANGFGIIIFRRLSHVIDTIKRLQQALMKFLLILIVLVAILFLFALPFTGLTPLWESGGSELILWMQALILFFVNAVYQDKPDQRPYSLWLHRFVYFGIALLPIYSAISFYGLSLRVDQYGWSLARCWAFLVWFLLTLFPLGYLWGIVKKHDNWTTQLSRVNVIVGLAILSIMMIINSPLLDFRKVVVNDQLVRLEKNEISIENFDISYFRYKLARPGYEAIQNIKEKYATTNPEIVIRINQLYYNYENNQPSSSKEEFISAITILSDKTPPDLLDQIYENENDQPWQLENTQKYYLQSLDLNKDSQNDYLLVSQRSDNIFLNLYYFEKGKWEKLFMSTTAENPREDLNELFIKALKNNEFKITTPKWNHIEIEGMKFQIGIEP